MTPLCATQPAIAETELRHLQTPVTQMELVAIPDDSPWLYSALFQLRNLQRSGENHPGVGDLRVTDDTSMAVTRLLSNLAVKELPLPSLDVFSGGGVSIQWTMSSRELKFSIFPNQEIVYERYDGDELFDDGLLKNISAATQLMSWLPLKIYAAEGR